MDRWMWSGGVFQMNVTLFKVDTWGDLTLILMMLQILEAFFFGCCLRA